MNYRKYLLLGCLAAGLSVYTSCYYDNVEELDPNFGQTTCDTAGTISFSLQVKPIMESYCGTSGSNAAACHGSSGSSGIPLVTYSDVSDAVDNDNLLGSIKHLSGVSAMPKGGGKLDDCRIAKVEKWINQGKQNN